MDNLNDFDLGPLTWVKGEIDNALTTAKNQLKSWNGSDLAAIKTASTHLHQVFGALQIVDLQGVSKICEACEQLLGAMEKQAGLRTQDSADIALRAIEALQDYLNQIMEGGPHTELTLAPVYEALLTQQGLPPPAPSDLFYPDLDVRASRLAPEPRLDDDHRKNVLRRCRSQFQKGLVQWLTQREASGGLQLMREALDGVEQSAPGTAQYTFWWAANGLLENLSQDLIPADFWTKRLLGRLDIQLKRLIDGSRSLAERLLRDVLYYQAIAADGNGRAAEVRSLFDLTSYLPTTAVRVPDEHKLSRPALKTMRDALEQAKEHWLRFCSGKADSLPALQRLLETIRLQAKQLNHAALSQLADSLDTASQRLTGLPGLDQNEALHLELATTLLFAQSALDHFDALGPEFTEQVAAQSRRLQSALTPDADLAELPSLPLLDEISRQAQEKLLMSQVTQEIQANLHQVENILDAFFRNRAERGGLPLVPGLMNQILGALNMLQLDVAADLVKLTMTQTAILSEPEREISQDELDWIAEAVSSLGIYVEALRYGRDDPGALRSLLSGPGQHEPGDSSLENELSQQRTQILEKLDRWANSAIPTEDRAGIEAELNRIEQDAELVGDTALQEQARLVLSTLATSQPKAEAEAMAHEPERHETLAPEQTPVETPPTEASSEEVDAELLEVYIAEAHEVLDTIAASLTRLTVNPGDQDAFTTIRRGFHTLKGSGRMVGLTAPAEVAWEVEQTLNLWLRDHREPTQDIVNLIQLAAASFRTWVEQLESQGHAQVEAEDLVALAQSLRAEPTPEPAIEISPSEEREPTPEALQDELTTVGDHTLPTSLYDIFIEEAKQRLHELTEHWNALLHSATPEHWESLSRTAHTLAGISRTTGFTPLAEATHQLELWARDWAENDSQPDSATDAAIAPFIANLHKQYRDILEGLYPTSGDTPATALPAPPTQEAVQGEPTPLAEEPIPAPAVLETSITDELDPELLPIFLAEAEELLPRIGESLRQWRNQPDDTAPRLALQRALHTLKGSARMAGALTLGDETHQMESRLIEQGEQTPTIAGLETLEHDYDHLADLVDQLKPEPKKPQAATADAALPSRPAPIDEEPRQRQAIKARPVLALDTLINETGEVSIARSRIENVMAGYKQTAEELTANVERMRSQLRELEIQAETQMRAHLTTLGDDHFDPLEFDRYTRLQELTRLMAESVNDVSTAQESLLSNLDEAEAALVQQAKMTRSLQQQLMHMRMVPLNSQVERLHRIVRQAAKETGHKARLHIEGGETELDRSVLDKVFVPLEHLLRNAVAHGIEPAEGRKRAGKPEYGDIQLAARAEGNEIILTLSDDGTGIDLARVRQRAEALGWLKASEDVSPERLEAMLFMPGLSTADAVTHVAGRGIGLDVVKSEVAAVGGRVRLESEPGQGTRIIIRLPLTLALAQVVLVKAATQTYALPANLVVLVREVRQSEWDTLSAAGHIRFEDQTYPLRSLNQLTDQPPMPLEGRYHILMLLRAGEERVALHVDALRGNAEVVVKNIGPQLARITGIAGATVLGDGRVALILNPFGLLEHVAESVPNPDEITTTEERAPLILVVDDSLTVRKFTSRLLLREGYRVATAKDGSEAMEMLEDELPAIMLLDIEMPRMDGFEVTRHIRANNVTNKLPIIMITSRTAEKHRDHAFDLGVDTFMGKPYQDEELLSEIKTLINKN